MKDERWPAMPYPGLRPFDVSKERDESVIFFGRKRQIYDLIDRLATSHLIAVLGPSGCGKSSLIRAGVIPNLEKGYLDRAGARWTAVVMEPGGRPVKVLASELHKTIAVSALDGMAPDRFAREQLEQELNSRPDALVELFEAQETAAAIGPDRNVLILVDQFEELFREDMTLQSDAQHFINLMLNVYHNPPERLYIVLTMRTDFIKQSACYPGLPTVLSHTMSLIDKIDNMGLRDAITEPVKLKRYRGEISEDMTRWILRQMTTEGPYDPDLLPLMQHALLLGWQNARKKAVSDAGEKTILRREDYAAYADLADCLSQHADALFSALTTDQQHIAEVMFRLLSRVTADGTKIRRITSVKEIASVAECRDAEKVRAVIDAFTAEGAGFIRWKGESKMLDVSHESFIRKWDKFDKWADREADKAQKYMELLRRAQDRQKTGLLDRLALGYYRQWDDETPPTVAWAARYQVNGKGGNTPANDFADVQDFLADSRTACRKQEKSKRNKRLMAIGIWALVAVVLPLLGFGLSAWKSSRAEWLYKQAWALLAMQPQKAQDAKEKAQAAIEKADAALKIDDHFLIDLLPNRLKRAMGIENRPTECHLTKARAYLLIARSDRSLDPYKAKIIESFKQIVHRDPTNTEAYKILVAMIEIQLESKTDDAGEKAQKICENIEEGSIVDTGIYIDIGDRYKAKGLNRNALEMYEKASTYGDNGLRSLVALGEINLIMHNLKRARTYFEQAQKLDAKNPIVRIRLSEIHIQNGERDKAIACLEKVVHDDQQNKEACANLVNEYFNMTYAHLQMGSKAMVPGDLSKIKDLVCLTENDHMRKGQLLMDTQEPGALDSAIEAFEVAIKMMKAPNPEPYFMLANAYAQKQSYAEAIEHYNNVLNIKRNDFRAIRGKAFCREMQGRTKDAAKLYRQAEQFEPWAQPAATLPNDGITIR